MQQRIQKQTQEQTGLHGALRRRTRSGSPSSRSMPSTLARPTSSDVRHVGSPRTLLRHLLIGQHAPLDAARDAHDVQAVAGFQLRQQPPAGKANTARSNSGTVSPRPSWPRLPPTAADGQLDCSRATSAKRDGSAISSSSTTPACAQHVQVHAGRDLEQDMVGLDQLSPTMKRSGWVW